MTTIGKLNAEQEVNCDNDLTLYSVKMAVFKGRNPVEAHEYIRVMVGAASAVLAKVFAIDYCVNNYRVEKRLTFSGAVGVEA